MKASSVLLIMALSLASIATLAIILIVTSLYLSSDSGRLVVIGLKDVLGMKQTIRVPNNIPDAIQDSYDLGTVEFRESGRGMIAWKARLLNNRASGILSGYVTVSALDSNGFEVGREVVDGFNIAPHASETLVGTVMVGKDQAVKMKAVLSEHWK